MPSYSRKIAVPGKSAEELYQKISSEIDRFIDKVPTTFGKFDLQKNPDQKQVCVKSKMATATLFCEDGELKLDAQLSLFASPFRSKLDESIDRWVQKTFG